MTATATRALAARRAVPVVVAVLVTLLVTVAGVAPARADAEGSLRDLAERARTEFDVPGLALVVVRDGEVVTLEGLGLADRESGTPVDPESSVFRIASVSKPLTALTVHLLAEDGLLDLGADVTDYVDVAIPGATPVTVGSLLTHTAGFESRNLGSLARDADDVAPLSVYVPANVPARFAGSGVVHSYSNFGYALDGYAAERAAGAAFAEVAERRVFAPLGMTSTTFLQGAPDGLAVGYSGPAGGRVAEPGVVDRRFPAAGAYTTAADMGAFLLALLGHAPDVVSPTVLEGYLAPAYRPHPAVPGRTGGGLAERWVGGTRVVGHGGDLGTFSAELAVVPDQDVGVFFAANTVDLEFSDRLLTDLLDVVVEEVPAPAPAFVDLPQERLAELAGAYRWTRFSRSTVEKVVAMTPAYNTFVRAPGDGTLVVTWLGVDERWVYRPIDESAFAKVSDGQAIVDGLVIDPGERIAFTTGGGVTYLNLSLHTVATEKVPLPLIGVVQASTIGVIVLLYLLALPGWGIGAWVRHRRGTRVTRGGRRVRGLALVQTVLVTGALTGLFLGLSAEFGLPPAAAVSIVLFTAAAVWGLTLIPGAVVAWGRGLLTVGERVQLTVLALTAPVLAWWTIYWNLFGWHV